MYNGGMPHPPPGVSHQFPGNPYGTMMPGQHDRPPFMGLPPGAPPMSFPPNFPMPPPGMGPPPGGLPQPGAVPSQGGVPPPHGPMPPHGLPQIPAVSDDRPPTSMPPQFTQG